MVDFKHISGRLCGPGIEIAVHGPKAFDVRARHRLRRGIEDPLEAIDISVTDAAGRCVILTFAVLMPLCPAKAALIKKAERGREREALERTAAG